jgi:hypothetical protein
MLSESLGSGVREGGESQEEDLALMLSESLGSRVREGGESREV